MLHIDTSSVQHMDETQREAAALKARFAGVNRAAFARDHQIPGGDAMIYQHITGRRPMSLESAIAYANAFNVPLAEISQRLAAGVGKARSVGLINTPPDAFSRITTQPMDPIVKEIADIASRLTLKSKLSIFHYAKNLEEKESAQETELKSSA